MMTCIMNYLCWQLGEWTETTVRGHGESFHKRPIWCSWSINGLKVWSYDSVCSEKNIILLTSLERGPLQCSPSTRWLKMCPVVAMVPPYCGMQSVNRLKVFLAVTCSLGVKVMLRSIKWLSGTEEECNANSVTWKDKDTCFRLRCHQFVQGYDPSVLPLSTLASV
ncbi:hypothetical protein ATANTOWER_003811 [Ataeniobius toweri]|uniref:Uncharacterized protein n=1 Tax=Ataeniobius toweri TaxID=208326 RepID=A0ABU7AEF7_9TELE|nr:hypothetical protein [Ataeniobius toweri]